MQRKMKPLKIKIPKSKPFVHAFTEHWIVDDAFDIHARHLFTDKTRGIHAMRFGVNDHQFEIYFYKSGRQIWVIPCGEKK